MENIIRTVSMVMLLSTAVISQSCTSPTTRCDCFQKDGKTIINCRYKNLTAIPTFTNTNQVYDEIRFTSFEETGTCQPFAGCNNIRQIGANAFNNLKVKKIDLLNNPVTMIDHYAFEGLAPEIESISLEGDGLNGMPDQALAALDEQLKTLHLENYGDTSIEAPIVFPFPHLESLTIKKWKNLKSINADIFGVMKDLKELKLISLRDIAIFPVPAIQKFLNLTSLDIMDIGITSIDGDSFTPMSLLKDIKIRNNIHLNTIDQRTFSGVTDTVEFLEIDNNNLNNKLSLEFLRNENWTVLSHLNIGYNFNLRDLPSEIFSKTPALAYLQCQDIGLTSINKDMFSGLVSLHTLDLAYNNIRTVTPQTFKNSPSLVELRLHDQQSIDYLDIQNNAFSGIETSLEILSLQNNKLNVFQFWMDLSTLTNLLVLEVDNTGIENIPNRAFRNNVKLTNLHIADNKITSLKQETFFGPRDTLQTIYINRNKIQTVDQCTLSDFPVRPKLILVGNPLNCNCDLAWLYDWFKLQCNQTHETDACQEIGQCASPVSLTNKNFTEFNKNEMCPTGATIRNCPDIYLTTTTKTTTSRTTTTTTPICTTPPLPEFEILINNRASTFIEITWVINDRTHVTGLKLELISNYQSNKEAYPGLDAKSHTFYQLREDTTFTFCLVLKIENEYRDTQPKCKSTTTFPPLTDTPSSTTTVAPEKISVSFSSTILGVVIGGIVVILMFTLFIGIFIYYRRKKHLTLSELPNLTVRNNLNHNKTEEFHKTSSKDRAIEQYDMSVISSSSDYFCQCTTSRGISSDVNEGSLKADSVLSTVGNFSDNVKNRRSSNPVDHSRLSVSRGVTNVGFVSSTNSLEKF